MGGGSCARWCRPSRTKACTRGVPRAEARGPPCVSASRWRGGRVGRGRAVGLLRASHGASGGAHSSHTPRATQPRRYRRRPSRRLARRYRPSAPPRVTERCAPHKNKTLKLWRIQLGYYLSQSHPHRMHSLRSDRLTASPYCAHYICSHALLGFPAPHRACMQPVCRQAGGEPRCCCKRR